MDLAESFRTLRRHWILTLSLILLTLLGAAAALVKLPWTYTSQSTIVLLASEHAAKQSGGNPYLAFDSSLSLTANIVRRTMMDPHTGQDLASHGYTATYQVTDATDTSGPFSWSPPPAATRSPCNAPCKASPMRSQPSLLSCRRAPRP